MTLQGVIFGRPAITPRRRQLLLGSLRDMSVIVTAVRPADWGEVQFPANISALVVESKAFLVVKNVRLAPKARDAYRGRKSDRLRSFHKRCLPSDR